METRIREVTPAELPAAVDDDETTLVVGAPGIGKSFGVSQLDWPVRPLADTGEENGPVVVDDFVAELRSNDHESTDAFRELCDRKAGAVMVTRPRSLDWYYQCYENGRTRSRSLLDRFDTVLVVRIPPTEATEAVRVLLDDIYTDVGHGHRVRTDSSRAHEVRELFTTQPYQFEAAYLDRHLGWYGQTVVPGELAALTARETESVVFGSALADAVEAHATDLGPFVEAAIRPADLPFHDETPGVTVEAVFSEAGPPRELPADDDPALEAAVALVASHAVAGETDWLDTLTEIALLPTAEEAIETALSLPPGTIEWVAALASDHVRQQFLDRIHEDDDDGPIDRGSDTDTDEALLAALDDHADAVGSARALFEELEVVAAPATDHSEAFAPWYRQPRHEVPELYSPEQDPVDASEQTEDVDSILDALDGNLVVVTGSLGEGVHSAARRAGERLQDWGVEVCVLPGEGLSRTLERQLDVLGAPVCLCKLGNPRGVTLDPGQLVSPDDFEWVLDRLEAGHTSGVIISCPDKYSDSLHEGIESADCTDHPVWEERVELSVSGGPAASNQPAGPEAVAEKLLSRMGFDHRHQPTYPEIDSTVGRSDISILADATDAQFGPAYLGEVLAAAAVELSTTFESQDAAEWLTIVDEYLRAAAERHEADGTTVPGMYGWDGDKRAPAFRTMYAQAMVELFQDDYRTHEWIGHVDNLAAEAGRREFRNSSFYPLDEAHGEALGRLLTAGDDGPDATGVMSLNELLLDNLNQVDQKLEALTDVYSTAAAWVLDDSPDPAFGWPAMQFLCELLQEGIYEFEERVSGGEDFGRLILGNLLTVPHRESVDEEFLGEWVERIDDRCVDILLELQEPYPPRYLVADYYGYAIGRYALGDNDAFEEIETWLSHVENRIVEAIERPAVEVGPAVFSQRTYSTVVRTTLFFREPDQGRAYIPAFSAWFRRQMAAADHDESTAVALARAQGKGLEELGDYERIRSGAEDIEAWFEALDSQVQTDANADWHDIDPATYFQVVYGGTLSRRQMGRPWDGDLRPRSETRWFDCLTDRIRSTALEQAHPAGFVLSVYGDALEAWISSDERDETTLAWVEALLDACCDAGRELDTPDDQVWFRDSPAVFGRLFAAIAASTRSDRVRRELGRTVRSTVTELATDPSNPLSAGTYTTQVFARALERTAGVHPQTQSFRLSELVTTFRRAELTTVDDDEMAFAAVAGNAIAAVVLADRPSPYAESWLREMASTLRDLPDGLVDQEERFITTVYGVVRHRLDGSEAGTLERTLDELLASTVDAVAGTTGDTQAIRESVHAVAERLASAEFEELEHWEPASLADATAAVTDDSSGV